VLILNLLLVLDQPRYPSFIRLIPLSFSSNPLLIPKRRMIVVRKNDFFFFRCMFLSLCVFLLFFLEFPELSGFLIDSWKELVWLVYLFYLASAVVRFLFVLVIMFLFLFPSFRWYKIQSFLSFKLFPNHIYILLHGYR